MTTIDSARESRPSPGPSRRQFLRLAGAASAIAPTALGAIASPAPAAPPAAAPARAAGSGSPILIRNGCVLSLDRQVGDFERADVLVQGARIAAVRPGISAPNAEVI